MNNIKLTLALQYNKCVSRENSRNAILFLRQHKILMVNFNYVCTKAIKVQMRSNFHIC